MNPSTLEHIKPHSKGGVNSASNYLAIHAKCNEERGNIAFDTYLRTHRYVINNIQANLNKLRGKIIGGIDYVPEVIKTLNREAKGVVSFKGKKRK